MLPNFFNNNKFIEPIYDSLIEINFNNDILYFQINSINNDSMFFNVNISNDNKIEPLYTIMDMIKLKYKTNIIINRLSKEGNIILKMKLYNFRFKSINNLLDFDFSNENLYNLETKFTFDKLDIIKNNSLQAQRLSKINKLLKRNDNNIITLTKKELNFD